VSGQQLDAFFRLYLYQAELPVLRVVRDGDTLTLSWTNTGDIPFDVPVPVAVDGEVRRVGMANGQATLDIPAGASVVIDEKGWILKDLQVETR
jgi:aminopeptidase N